VTDQPPFQVDLDACVTCGLCLPVCPTFRLTGDESASPRGRLTAIGAVAGGVIEVDDRFDEVTSFCLQCRACETACPSLVPYGDIIEAAREEAVQQVRHRGRRLERLAIGRILGWPVMMRIASIGAALLQRVRLLTRLPRIGEQARGLRPIPLRSPSLRGGSWGSGTRTVTLFTGCVADVWFTEVHQAAVELLVAAGYRVEAPAAQTCCGALAAHAGLGRDARRYAARNIEVLKGSDVIAVDVAGCGAHLKGYGRHGGAGAAIAASTYDITELIASAIAVGDLPTLEPTGKMVAVVDPCHLEHGQRITDQPRRIVEAGGFTVVDADRGGLCCGAAGLYQLDHPDTGATLGRRKAAAVGDTAARIVAVANAGCEIQLRRFLDEGFDIVHPVELYAAALRTR
jgi:glycolate oxidase iron-sulfur subunit